MSTGCPDCDATIAKLEPDDRARIPLRQAAHAFREAGHQLFKYLIEHGRLDAPHVAELEDEQRKCDDALAAAAIAYAATVHGGHKP